MPLFHKSGEKAFKHNVREEVREGNQQKQSLAIAFNLKRRAKKAKGGEITVDNYKTGSEMSPPGAGPQPSTKSLAEGGKVCTGCGMRPCECATVSDDQAVPPTPVAADYSEGGRVANGDGDPPHIDELALDDDLEFSDTGANSGDELGDSQEESDRKGIVDRIMHSLAKKDKPPRPA